MKYRDKKYTNLQEQEIVISWQKYCKWKGDTNKPGEAEFLERAGLPIVRKTLYNYCKKWENQVLRIPSYRGLPHLAEMEWED